MPESPATEYGVSALDRAHALRLARQPEAALQLAAIRLEAAQGDIGAALLVARLLWELGRPAQVMRAAEAALERFVARGDLGSAWLAVDLIGEAGGERAAHWSAIAQAFGAGSERVGDGPAMPPPLPSQAPPAESLPSGVALLAAAERGLGRFSAARDPLPPATPLPRLPLFGALTPDTLAQLLAALTLQELPAGQPVVKQGERARAMYLLVRGVLNVTREADRGATLLAALGPGALFGEMALVSRAARSASVTSVEPAQVLALPAAELEVLAAREPTIGRELARFCQQRMLANLARHSRILSAVPADQRQALLSGWKPRSFAVGEALVRQGQAATSAFLIASGEAEVSSRDADGDRLVLARVGAGDVVGEISLVLRRAVTADVVALESIVALELSGDEFHAVIREYPGLLQQLYAVATEREAETSSVVAQPAVAVTDSVLL
jgi:CRP-like cAMP-binding protein